jgi:tetratricopeptide (TPR) repeat protein
LGLPKDDEKASMWLGKAAGQGHVEAKKELGVLKAERGSADEEARAEEPAVEDAEGRNVLREDLLEEWYREGLKEKESGNFSKAVVIWKRILEKNFRHLNAVNGIACVYAQTGRLDKAKKYIDMALRVGGDKADFVRVNLAGIFYCSARFEEAEEILDSIKCKDARTISNLTRVLFTQGKLERAIGLIEEYLSRERSFPDPGAGVDLNLQEIVARGVDCMLGCRPYDAIGFLGVYSGMLPPELRSMVYFNAGIHFLQEEDDGISALDCLSEAVKSDPDDPEMKEALSDAALKVIEELEGKKRLFKSEKLALALACETVGDRRNPPPDDREEKKPALRIVKGKGKNA